MTDRRLTDPAYLRTEYAAARGVAAWMDAVHSKLTSAGMVPEAELQLRLRWLAPMLYRVLPQDERALFVLGLLPPTARQPERQYEQPATTRLLEDGSVMVRSKCYEPYLSGDRVLELALMGLAMNGMDARYEIGALTEAEHDGALSVSRFGTLESHGVRVVPSERDETRAYHEYVAASLATGGWNAEADGLAVGYDEWGVYGLTTAENPGLGAYDPSEHLRLNGFEVEPVPGSQGTALRLRPGALPPVEARMMAGFDAAVPPALRMPSPRGEA
jgi:hypothetical protein